MYWRYLTTYYTNEGSTTTKDKKIVRKGDAISYEKIYEAYLEIKNPATKQSPNLKGFVCLKEYGGINGCLR